MMTYDLSDLLLCLKEILKIIRNSPHETDSAEVPCTGSFLVPSLQSSTPHGSETETDATRCNVREYQRRTQSQSLSSEICLRPCGAHGATTDRGLGRRSGMSTWRSVASRRVTHPPAPRHGRVRLNRSRWPLSRHGHISSSA
jgi:hypothetical protein